MTISTNPLTVKHQYFIQGISTLSHKYLMMILTEEYKYRVLPAIGVFRGNVERQAHSQPSVEVAATTKKFQLGHWLVRG